MKVGLFYDKIDGSWTYTGFERQLEPTIKDQSDTIEVFIADSDFDIQDGLDEFYEGDSNSVVVYVDISTDGKELLSREVEIEELVEQYITIEEKSYNVRRVNMGAWGYKIEDNDTALDFLSDFQKLTSKDVLPYKAIDTLLNDGYYENDTSAILMAAKLEHIIYGKIKHIEKVEWAFKQELLEETLEDWSDPEKRKEELLKFKDMING